MTIAGICHSLAWAQTVELNAGEPKLPERHYELTPLPLPTEGQLQRGLALVKKIQKVVNEVPLMDSTAVMGTFGLTDLKTSIYPTHVEVQSNAVLGLLKDQEITSTGITDLTATPWHLLRLGRPRQIASLSGSVNRDIACISLDAVQAAFGLPKSIQPVVYAHPKPERRPVNQIGHIFFGSVPTPLGSKIGAISFTFDYQFCADSFSVSYIL